MIAVVAIAALRLALEQGRRAPAPTVPLVRRFDSTFDTFLELVPADHPMSQVDMVFT